MPSEKETSENFAFRNLPSVDEMLRMPDLSEIKDQAGSRRTSRLVSQVLGELRAAISSEIDKRSTRGELTEKALAQIKDGWLSAKGAGTRRVINATGVVIHTNLGRAPLSKNARQALMESSGYSALEYDLKSGKRGRRGGMAEDMLTSITNAEDVLIVNNCAAAAFFVLTAFAAGGEVVISRGELVEIGGDFRVPDVLTLSGATLREVGTTNRTKVSDFEKAISDKTRIILRVHPSNYRIVGFTAMPSTSELCALSRKHGLLFYEDLGSGALIDMSGLGLKEEPVVGTSFVNGVDIVSFSGDKLLGGPQAGIIAGRKELIQKLRKHPLYRALRLDKLRLAALEATLEAYLSEKATEQIPVLKMLSATVDEIVGRVMQITERLSKKLGPTSDLILDSLDGESAIGGGAAPDVQPLTRLLSITHKHRSAVQLEEMLRSGEPPVIARIENDRVVMDLRTVSVEDEDELLNAILGLN